MNIRRKTFDEIVGKPNLQKALAFAILLKRNSKRDSTIRDFSINRLRKMSGLSATTVCKYLSMLESQGWAHYEGKDRQHLVIGKLASSTGGRNINIDRFCFDSFKDVYNSIRSYLVALLQSRKDFIKRTIQTATNPKRGQNFKAARKKVKRLVQKGILRDIYTAYKEYGISYQRIGQELGNCARTAFRVIEYATSHRLLIKHHNQEQVFAPKVHYAHVPGYTFSTKNNLYLILANTYTLPAPVPNGIISL